MERGLLGGGFGFFESEVCGGGLAGGDFDFGFGVADAFVAGDDEVVAGVDVGEGEVAVGVGGGFAEGGVGGLSGGAGLGGGGGFGVVMMVEADDGAGDGFAGGVDDGAGE